MRCRNIPLKLVPFGTGLADIVCTQKGILVSGTE